FKSRRTHFMHIYGLIIGISLLIGINYFLSKNVIPKNHQNFFIFGLVIFSIIGARLYHVIDQWPYYSQHLLSIPATWNGGLGIYGGLLAGIIFIFFYSLLTKTSILKILDAITPILPLCQSIGRLGNFVNQEIPLWYIEAALNLILFFVIKLSPKNPTAKYFIGYGLIRFIFEFFRSDTWVISQIKIAQLISIIFIFTGFYLLINNYNSSKINNTSIDSDKN
ncbi:MAG TPA: prolipoprotein diacylglyceryl transferase, partial [Candidatus Woesebacteria bacterium]|nr:prolipoprotein diacylglyceryl transferase [Candidatus Woesebacteria bacterium]